MKNNFLISYAAMVCLYKNPMLTIDLRREAAVMEGFERFKRLDPNHPNSKLVESKRPNQFLKQNSILDIAENLKDKYKLPENREQKCIF